MLNLPKKSPDAIVETLRQAKNILIAAHVFPDGDALGSLLALGDILESFGKEVYLYCEESASHLYARRYRTSFPN